MKVSKIIQETKTKGGVSLFKVKRGKLERLEVQTGYIVSVFSYFKGSNIDEFTHFLEFVKNSSEYGLFGTYKENNNYYVDGNIHTMSIEHALQLGRIYNQSSIYDVVNDRCLFIQSAKKIIITELQNKVFAQTENGESYLIVDKIALLAILKKTKGLTNDEVDSEITRVMIENNFYY
jgi:hypothetical protein